MKFLRTLPCILFILSTALAAPDTTPPTSPDILVIYTDDHRADALGCAGTPHLATPRIDRLASQGTYFPSAYLPGGNSGALCMPSRAMLMTGRSFARIAHNGAWSLAPQPTLPSLLREHGYRTFMTGKWHNGRDSLARAFPDAGSVFVGGMGDHFHKPLVQIRNGELSEPLVSDKHSTDVFTDEALAFISALTPRDPPFFLYLAYTAPHDPRQPVSPWREHQEASPPPLPPNYLPLHPFNNGALAIRDEHLAPWPRPATMIREQTAHYYAMIEQLDAAVGRVIDALARAGRLERTIIVFAGDNGLALGSHGLVGKQSAYEHSLRIPLIITGPGLPAGRRHEGLVAIPDIMPTLLDLAGIPVPAWVDGRSLKPVLAGENRPVRDRLSLSVYFDDLSIHALREGPWKLIRYPYLDRTQLFHLADDPHEMHDLSAESEQAARVASLSTALAAELRTAGVEQPLVTERRIPSTVDWTKFTQKMDRSQPAWIRQRFSAPPATAP